MAGGHISIGRTGDAYVLRLAGRCTMSESPAAHAFIEGALRDSDGRVFVDVSQCTYLDSTFLGSLLGLHRHHGKQQRPRFSIVATPEARAKLFEATHLHKVFNFADDDISAAVSAWVDMDCHSAGTPQEMARHVMECHRRLAELEGPNQAAFTAIAQQLERELMRDA